MTSAAASLLMLAAVGQVAVVQAGPEVAVLGPGGLYDLDLEATAKALYADHPDLFDVLVLWPDFRTTADGGALYQPVANSTAGINFDQGGKYPQDYDVAADYGSTALQGVVVMGSLDGLSDAQALDVVAEEVAHQYAAMVSFIPATGGPGHTGLLGKAGTHWSFFPDTGGSVLGGNRWEADGAEGGRRWVTGAPGGAYGPFDLYLMGLIAADEVPPMRWMPSPTIVSPSLDPRGRSWEAASPSTAGVVVEGDWEEVSLAQVVAAEGERVPEAGRSSADFRQAWAIVVPAGEPPTAARREQVDRIYAGWPAHFDGLTGGLGRAIVTLDGSVPGEGDEGCGCGVGRPARWPLFWSLRR